MEDLLAGERYYPLARTQRREFDVISETFFILGGGGLVGGQIGRRIANDLSPREGRNG